MRDLKNFNNNPNMSLFRVKYKPKSARGLFGASSHTHPMSSESLMDISKHRSEMKDQSKDNTTDIRNLVAVRSCPGEPLHQLNPLGVSWVLRETKE